MSNTLTNLLIDALPAKDKAGLLRDLHAFSLPVGTILFEANQPAEHVHFITSGMASIVTPMHGGVGVEVGLVSNEGFAEFVQMLGPQHGAARCFMQIGGTGLRMEFKKFERYFAENAALRGVVLRYVQYQMNIVSQLAACNRLHEVEERLARWLLMVQDRIQQPEIPLTQEFLAEMLGTRRSTVTVTAGLLQSSGMIEYHRGQICILNRAQLKATTCECYALMEQFYATLWPGVSV